MRIGNRIHHPYRGVVWFSMTRFSRVSGTVAHGEATRRGGRGLQAEIVSSSTNG